LTWHIGRAEELPKMIAFCGGDRQESDVKCSLESMLVFVHTLLAAA
jgi:hypothetical protein